MKCSVCVCVCVCVCVGDNRSPWVRVWLDDGSFYFFHLNQLEGSWDKPNGFIQNSVFLDQHDIQVRHTWCLGSQDCLCVSPIQF